MLAALSKVDYSHYGVLVAYMGASLNTGSAITAEKVIRNGNTINVLVTQNKPESGDQAVVNYFHAIAVKRTELPDPRKITVSLWINDSWNAVQGRGYIPHRIAYPCSIALVVKPLRSADCLCSVSGY
ncbi:hypothetical protein TFLX_04809 [Thermoflexales bacterium]|nr:hypothetical protein TFLX_04809 [Thermoflexales bacterium]